jgi:hypothetical protein
MMQNANLGKTEVVLKYTKKDKALPVTGRGGP